MEKFVLSTDTCCDEFKSKLKADNIEFVSMKYILNEEIYADNADSMEDYEEFYSNMRSGKIYSTSALNMFEIKEYFEMLLKNGANGEYDEIYKKVKENRFISKDDKEQIYKLLDEYLK